MTPTITVDTSRFQAAWRKYLASTSRSLPAACNSRMFYLLVRVYLILSPQSPVEKRKQFRSALYQKVSVKGSKGREVERIYAIVNSKRRPGLYGEKMRVAAKKVLSRTIGGVGYLRAMTVRGIRRFQGFKQFGTKSLKTGKYNSANKAAIALSAQYNAKQESVAIYRASQIKAVSTRAQEGYSPMATLEVSGASVPVIGGSVYSVLNPAFNRSLADETLEMETHCMGLLVDAANKEMVQNGFKVNE